MNRRRKSPEETRASLVEATVKLILGQGFAATRVDEICREAGVTKGAFFHHFASKEDIGKAAIDWWGRMGDRVYSPAWSDDGRDPLTRLNQMLEIMHSFTERPDPCVCVVGMMSQEYGQTDTPYRECCQQELDNWTKQVAKLLAEAKKKHRPGTRFDPLTVANFLNSLWQGSMLIAKTQGQPRLIQDNLAIARSYLLTLFPGQADRLRHRKPKTKLNQTS
ncbi:MAG: TetR/AcrR family transcriptional regulator [Verrucomicrobiota bacterium JB023]|nr:TetR/AcrR family transcriptional regulator [Verrucomicrobiota bacterium JB023]